MSPATPCRRSAFTLVELLVVVGILAALIAMLMPALQRARQQAINVQCMANLRQVGQALQLYLNGQGGRSLPQDMSYRTLPAPYGSDGVAWYEFLLGNDTNGKEVVTKYLSTDKVLSCPAMNPAKPGMYGMLHSQASDPVLININTTGAVPWNYRGTRWSRIRQPSDFALVFDTTANDSGTKFWTGGGSWWPDRYNNTTNSKVYMAHGKHANGLFADWHVESCDDGRLVSASNYNPNADPRRPGQKSGIQYWFSHDFKNVKAW